MSRPSSTNRQYLERHGGKWRVTVSVPRSLQKSLGCTKLKAPLGTDSLADANHLKKPVVLELMARIDRAAGRRPRTGEPDLAQELARLYRTAAALGDTADMAALEGEISLEYARILGRPVSREYDEEIDENFDVYEASRQMAADAFLRRTRQRGTPLNERHNDYLAWANVSRRTQDDDLRAVKYLHEWCVKNDKSPSLESIDRLTAIKFVDELPSVARGSAPSTLNKYIGRLNRYWLYLENRGHVTQNVWRGLKLKTPLKRREDRERSFTHDEVRRLLIGGAPTKLIDAMMIGALSGARLDAIVDLKVGDVRDGAFKFKPQKREPGARYVPIHSQLMEIVARRTKGKAPEDEFFPDWPRAKEQGSNRERSFKTSNAFTLYRRKCGVDDVVVGNRRSKVNFHSFRRWFITEAERVSNGNKDLVAAIVGHSRNSITFDLYSDGPKFQQAKRCIEKIKLPPLTQTPVEEPRGLNRAVGSN